MVGTICIEETGTNTEKGENQVLVHDTQVWVGASEERHTRACDRQENGDGFLAQSD